MSRKEKPYTTDDLDDGHLIILRAMVAHEATIHYSRDGDLAWLSAADGRRFPVLPPEATLQPLRDTRMLSYDADDEDGNDSNTTRITDAGRAYVAAREGQGVGRQFLAVDIACRPKKPKPEKRADDVTRAAETYVAAKGGEGAAKEAALAAIGSGALLGDLDGSLGELAALIAQGEPYGHGTQADVARAERILRIVALSAAAGALTRVLQASAEGQDLSERRSQAADAAFEAYDFGTYAISDTSGWEHSGNGDRLDRTIWFESEEGSDAKGSFTVTFAPGTDAVADAYGTCNGEDVGARAGE